jgi:Phospholipase_D-nuclease N-terminal/Short C-terminal domain
MENFWSFFWGLLWFFFLFMWLMLLFQIFADLFRDHETSGGMKALWVIFLVFLPILGVLVYVIARGHGMAERQRASQVAAQKQFDDYVKETAGTKSAADQIASAKALLDQGAITQSEYEQMKAKALA